MSDFSNYIQKTSNRSNIISWYKFKENSKILDLNPISNIISDNLKEYGSLVLANTVEEAPDELFDYIILIGLNNVDELNKKLKFAVDHLNKNGRILLCYDNKFGIKYWAGVKEDLEKPYQALEDSDRISLKDGLTAIEENNLHYKIYYPLPDYTLTNVIYSDDYLPTEDSIWSRDIEYYSDNDTATFIQRKILSSIINDDENNFKLYTNTYFFELGKQEVTNDIRYVNFEIYRKSIYDIKAVMTKDFVYKTANNANAKKHIETIKSNIDLMNSCKIKTLDSYDGDIVKSKFTEAISLEKYLKKVFKKEGKEAALAIFDSFINKVIEPLEDIDAPKEDVFDKFEIELGNKEKLHFIKQGLIDLIVRNAFYIDDDFYVYDQEWVLDNVPKEFIIYRNILYTDFGKIATKDELYKKYGIFEFIDVFKALDDKFQKIPQDEEFWQIHVDGMSRIGSIEDKKASLEAQYEGLKARHRAIVDEKDKQIKQLYKNITNLKDENNSLIASNNSIKLERNDLENRLRIIEKSLSWKLTKPLRYASWRVRQGKELIRNIKQRMQGASESANNAKMLMKHFPEWASKTDNATAKYWKKFLIKRVANEKQNRGHGNDYDYWMDANDPTFEELEAQRNHKFEYEPKISIITPLYNTKTDFFRDLLFTLVAQTYTNWELCLADGSPEPLKEIQSMIKNDDRIKYVFLNKNGGIAENTNEALKLATGDFIALMDHDDTLSLDCLYENVKVINEHPDVEFIYSDEDKITEVGLNRFVPHFKPDFAIDTLRCENYICHFSVFRKDIMDKLEGERSKYDGAQDFDLILRMSEVANHKNIIHIPKILYHWRVSETSTAGSEDSKPYAYIAGEKAVQDHLDRLGLKATAKRSKYYGLYDTKYEVIGKPKVNIIIPNKDGIDILEKCVDSILEKTFYDNYEIDIVENNSQNEETFLYYKELEKNPKIKILYFKEEGFNYSKLINFGVENTDGEFCLQLNNDTEVINGDWLENLISICQREDVGIVGGKLLYPDDTIQHAGIILGMTIIAGHIHRGLNDVDLGFFARAILRQDLTAVTGACLMTKRSIYNEVNGMNEDFAVAFNDLDFCLKVRQKGYLVVYEPTARLYHYESKTRGYDELTGDASSARFSREVELFRELWGKELKAGDPYFNKNLNPMDINCAVSRDKVEY